MYRIENNEKCNICINNNKIDLSMTAKEMFEKANYKCYINNNSIYCFKDDLELEFNKKEKELLITDDRDTRFRTTIWLTKDDLKAIKKAIEEMELK